MKSKPVVSANFLERVASPGSRFHYHYLAFRKGEVTRAEFLARTHSPQKQLVRLLYIDFTQSMAGMRLRKRMVSWLKRHSAISRQL